jgi:hypothetical protein
LAFHPYPHLIPPVCNLGGFGPPRPLTAASPWTWVDHPASGLQHTTQRPIQTRFRSGSTTRLNLAAYHNSQAHSSKGTPSPAYMDTRPMPGSDGLQAHGFRHSFTPLPGYFSPFPHGTLHYRSPDLFRLSRRSCQIHTSLHETRATRVRSPNTAVILHLRDSHPLRSAFPHRSTRQQRVNLVSAETNGNVPQPLTRNACRLSHEPGLASSAFARRYSRNHSCFLHSRY